MDTNVEAYDDRWVVKSSNAQRASDVFDNKDDAVERARKIAKNKGTSLTIYRQDGSVQEHHSY